MREGYWNEHAEGKWNQAEKDIPSHLEEAEEDYGIHTNLFYKSCFFDFYDWADPVKNTSSDRWWRVFLVCVFGSWGVYIIVAWSYQTE